MTEQAQDQPNYITNPSKVGRPSRLNPKLKDNLITSIKLGNTLEAACGVVGLPYDTFAEWRQRGEGRHPTRKPLPDYVQFAQEVNQAIAEAQLRLIKRIHDASDNDWKAAAWILERRHPEHWSATQRVQLAVEQELEKAIEALEKRLPPDVYDQVLNALAYAEGGTTEDSTEAEED